MALIFASKHYIALSLQVPLLHRRRRHRSRPCHATHNMITLTPLLRRRCNHTTISIIGGHTKDREGVGISVAYTLGVRCTFESVHIIQISSSKHGSRACKYCQIAGQNATENLKEKAIPLGLEPMGLTMLSLKLASTLKSARLRTAPNMVI